MDHKKPVAQKKRIWQLVMLFAVLNAILWGLQWVFFERSPLPENFEGDQWVNVSEESWLIIAPTQTATKTGLIFYPGGRIDYRGYLTLLKEISAAGYLVVVPDMPLNMAPFKPNVASEIIASFPDVTQWVIGGHSVGGTMAAQYTHAHPDDIAGLVIWASYPANNADLSSYDLPVALIYGDLDPRVNEESIAKRRRLLPAQTDYVRIEGGGHHQFGSYAVKPTNHQAAIPRSVQHEQIIQATLGLLDSISEAAAQ
jgi:pimeloyl-ACP methyl ester carboxylesterase